MIEVTREQYDEMIAHAREDVPNECVGLLFGKATTGEGTTGPVARSERLLRMENTEHSPLNFNVDGRALLRAFDEMEQLGLDLIGIYHSHTHSRAYPSPTDVRYAAGYPDAHYVIVSLADAERPDLRAFTIVDGNVTEQEVVVR